jgi:hypothetical protein
MKIFHGPSSTKEKPWFFGWYLATWDRACQRGSKVGSNRNLFMILTGHDPRIWESTKSRFNDCTSRAAESMSSEAYQGPIHKLILQQKSKQNPEFNNYSVVVWLFPWINLCIWLFDGRGKVHIFSHFQCILINHVVWVVPISSKWQQNLIQYLFLIFPDKISLRR